MKNAQLWTQSYKAIYWDWTKLELELEFISFSWRWGYIYSCLLYTLLFGDIVYPPHIRPSSFSGPLVLQFHHVIFNIAGRFPSCSVFESILRILRTPSVAIIFKLYCLFVSVLIIYILNILMDNLNKYKTKGCVFYLTSPHILRPHTAVEYFS